VEESSWTFVIAYAYKPNLFLANLQSEDRAISADFKVTRRVTEGAVLDCVKLPTDEPIYVIRSESSVFLYSL
jgi:hypothetical protein